MRYYDRQAVWQVYKELSESTCHRRAPYSVTVDTNCWVTPWGEKRKEKTKMAGNQRGGGSLNDRKRNNMKKDLERNPHRIKTNSKPHARSYITSTNLDQHVKHDKVQMRQTDVKNHTCGGRNINTQGSLSRRVSNRTLDSGMSIQHRWGFNTCRQTSLLSLRSNNIFSMRGGYFQCVWQGRCYYRSGSFFTCHRSLSVCRLHLKRICSPNRCSQRNWLSIN